MKKNLNNIAIILALSLGNNLQTLTTSSYTHESGHNNEVDPKTRKANEEIEDLLINSEIPEPVFKKPSLFTVLLRQYGIQLFYTCFNIKTWLVKTYHNIKEVIYENPNHNERI